MRYFVIAALCAGLVACNNPTPPANNSTPEQNDQCGVNHPPKPGEVCK
jgi:hypothetical protein